MGQSTPFKPQPLTDLEFDRLLRVLTTAARRMSPDQVAQLGDALYDIRRSKRRRVELHEMIDTLR